MWKLPIQERTFLLDSSTTQNIMQVKTGFLWKADFRSRIINCEQVPCLLIHTMIQNALCELCATVIVNFSHNPVVLLQCWGPVGHVTRFWNGQSVQNFATQEYVLPWEAFLSPLYPPKNDGTLETCPLPPHTLLTCIYSRNDTRTFYVQSI